MVRINYVTPDGETVSVDAEVDETLMEAAVRYGVEGIVAACGGCLSCATFHAYIDKPWLSNLELPSEPEKDMLDYASHLETDSRLTCQIRVSAELDGVTVRMPPSRD